MQKDQREDVVTNSQQKPSATAQTKQTDGTDALPSPVALWPNTGASITLGLRHSYPRPTEAPSSSILKTVPFVDGERANYHLSQPMPRAALTQPTALPHSASPPLPKLTFSAVASISADQGNYLLRLPFMQHLNAESLSSSKHPINYSTLRTRDPNPPSFSTYRPPGSHHNARELPSSFSLPPDSLPVSSPPVNAADRAAGLSELPVFGGQIMNHSLLPPLLSRQRRVGPTVCEAKPWSPVTTSPGTSYDLPNEGQSGLSESIRLRRSTIRAFLGRSDAASPPASSPLQSDSEASVGPLSKLSQQGVASRRLGHAIDSTTTSGDEGDVDENSDTSSSDVGLAKPGLQSQLRKILHRTTSYQRNLVTTKDKILPGHDQLRLRPMLGKGKTSSPNPQGIKSFEGGVSAHKTNLNIREKT